MLYANKILLKSLVVHVILLNWIFKSQFNLSIYYMVLKELISFSSVKVAFKNRVPAKLINYCRQ